MSDHIAIPSANESPYPENAPRRPGAWSRLIYGFIASFLVGIILPALEASEPFYLLIALPTLFAWTVDFNQCRHYDRVGWYVKKPVFLPQLPYKMAAKGQTIVFGPEDIQVSTFLKNRTIPYSRILGVYIASEEGGVCLKGVEISVSDKPSVYDKDAPLTILDTGSGEATRTTLAILRSKAPQASRMEPPHWIEQGWMPRSGFKKVKDYSDSM